MARGKWLLAVLVCCGWLAPGRAEDGKASWERKVYTNTRKEKLPFRLLVPENYNPKHKYPLVVFLHGSGERGTDNNKLLAAGVVVFTGKQNRMKYPCFVVAPQCPGKPPLDYWNPPVDSGLVLGVISDIEKHYCVDAKRIYVTGLSDGGWGIWALLARYPNKFAAAVPICGRGDSNDAPKIAKVPLWVFHGAKDNVEPVKSSREMVAALKKAGGHPKYTEYSNEGHSCWDRAYRDPKLSEWPFAQKRQ
jgi:predicted peptidase